MRNLIIIITLSFLLPVLVSYKPVTALQPAVVEGTVISERNHKPVQNAHVYIVHGEEEALTNSKGEFRIETVQKFPLLLTIDQQQHERTKLTITAPSRKLVVNIKPKT